MREKYEGTKYILSLHCTLHCHLTILKFKILILKMCVLFYKTKKHMNFM